MKDVKLSLKLSVGFGLVLVLTGLVAYVGYAGLQNVSFNAGMMNNANQMVAMILDARRNEKNFMLRGLTLREGDTQNAVEKMNDLIPAFKELLAQTSAQLPAQADQELLASVGQNLDDYYGQFTDFVSLEQQKEEFNTIMGQRANDVFRVIDEMRTAQEKTFYADLSANVSQDVIKNHLAEIDNLNKVTNLMLTAHQYDKSYSFNNQEETTAAIKKLVEEMQSIVATMKDKAQTSDSRIRADSIRRNLNGYDAYIGNFVTLSSRQAQQESNMVTAARNVQTAAEDLRDAQQVKMLAAENIARNTALGVAGLALVIGVVAAISLSRIITTPIHKLQLISDEIADGNVNVDISLEQKDEVGQLAAAFRRLIAYAQNIAAAAEKVAAGDLTVTVIPKSANDTLGTAFVQMITNMRGLLAQVTASAAQLSEASEQLSQTAKQTEQAVAQVTTTIQQVARGATQQTESVNQTVDIVAQLTRAIDGVAKGAQEQASAVGKSSEMTAQISANIEQVTRNAQAGANGAAQAATVARAGANTVEQTIAGMATIKTKVGQSVTKVQEMGRRSGQIGDIVETIDDIASQTNLLALNAAIEAARAGEHGKGFAVVADEVRKLAEKSANATKEIGGLVKGIQQTVAEAVQAMNDGAKEVEAGVVRANESGASLVNILQAAETVQQQVEEIAGATQTMRGTASALVDTMETVSAVVEENTASTEEMAASSAQAAEAIENIASVSQENSAAVEEVSAAAQEMSSQIEEVSASAQTLSQMAQMLQSLVAQFKLTHNEVADIPANSPPEPQLPATEDGRLQPVAWLN